MEWTFDSEKREFTFSLEQNKRFYLKTGYEDTTAKAPEIVIKTDEDLKISIFVNLIELADFHVKEWLKEHKTVNKQYIVEKTDEFRKKLKRDICSHFYSIFCFYDEFGEEQANTLLGIRTIGFSINNQTDKTKLKKTVLHRFLDTKQRKQLLESNSFARNNLDKWGIKIEKQTEKHFDDYINCDLDDLLTDKGFKQLLDFKTTMKDNYSRMIFQKDNEQPWFKLDSESVNITLKLTEGNFIEIERRLSFKIFVLNSTERDFREEQFWTALGYFNGICDDIKQGPVEGLRNLRLIAIRTKT